MGVVQLEKTKNLLISMQGVFKDYSREGLTAQSDYCRALNNVSLSIHSGEFVFLTGSSGAGKSTLLKVILGLEKPCKGQISTLGQDLLQLNETQIRLLRQKIGIIFQNSRLISYLNVEENVALPCALLKMPESEVKTRTLEILHNLELMHLAQSNISTLSAGETQRVALARSLVHSPELIVADEPSGNLDPENARRLVQLLRDLKSKGSTVLLATHDMSLVQDFGGRVLELLPDGMRAKSMHQKVQYRVPSYWDRGADL